MISSLRTTASNPLTLLEPTSTIKELHQIHAQLLVRGHLGDPPLLSKFISVLALSQNNPQHLPYSRQILDYSPSSPTIFALNSLIRAHSKPPFNPLEGFSYYRQVLQSPSLSPDNFTFTFLIRASAHLTSVCIGAAAHAAAFKRGHANDPHVQSGLIHMYSSFRSSTACHRIFEGILNPDVVTQTAMIGAYAASGEIEFARKMFEEMPHRDAISWNAMIAGYSNVGRCREALELFSVMQGEGVSVSEATMVSVLTACANLGALDQGRWAHAYIQKKRIQLTVELGTALIDMYSKCGCVGRAMEVFESMPEKNVYTWSSAMSGLAMNGAGKQCIEVFELMEKEKLEPNQITFVSVLRGCSMSGLVDRGLRYFDLMKSTYGIEPWPEHYGCMVDLYGRAGRLEEALQFIKSMPCNPHTGAWGALLNACKIYRNIELGELAQKKILELEAMNDGAYVLLSNIYADSRNWKGVSNVRELMKAKGVRKEPGCSVIEVAGTVHEFFVGDKSHPMYREIEIMLGEINWRLKLAGYEAKTNEVLFDIEEEEKENALFWHSEKLAIAYGLIVLKEGLTIRIVKNLRVCWDCHDVSKFISKVFEREIIVRDRNRFHHFKDGVCSCQDYW
ncbi:putative pentatricopeptide repeat-containing protein At5g40405 [Phalaenopsis equestris]|uniref:putative pentatricopeptide repeat-containing protein At5g40405 n=1 Tax=Phalaenopsis equestris TaxID=78828 RepID=UPI0009E253AA|nr:putative pentatricopeptide repeat-containing protein At5g40405 [Phalaenopsis equestris]